MPTIVRQQAGIPAGGQFAAFTHTEPALHLEQALTLEQALDLSTLPVGETRAISPDVHGIAGIDEITLSRLPDPAPSAAVLFMEPSATAAPAPQAGRTRIRVDVKLPESANIAELYEDDDRLYRAARAAALDEVRDLIGQIPGPYNPSVPGLPEDQTSMDSNGNLAFTHFESQPGTAVDPDDLNSWMSNYQAFSDTQTRDRLMEAITERYDRR